VSDQTAAEFRQIDLWHLTSGVSLTSRRLSGSLGVGYSSGEGTRAGRGGSDPNATVPNKVHVGTLSVLYALTFGF
jgi:hypothetical protein